MANTNEPVMLELAHLPREQIGPFLLLGLRKDSGKEEIEARWAERIKWARKQTTILTLEEINWARDLINDHARRMVADAGCVNPDTTDGSLSQITRRYNNEDAENQAVGFEILDEEKALGKHEPAVEVPDLEATRAAITVPDVPRQFPVAGALLAELAASPLDPWDVRL